MVKETRQGLLLAAVKEFAMHGYRVTTVRNIVARAGERNINAIAYYFGGKEQLYKEVLEFMFREAEKFKEGAEPSGLAGPTGSAGSAGLAEPEPSDAKARLESMIRFYCRAYYAMETELDRDLYQLFVKEAADPGPYFREMAERHLRPAREHMCSLLREYLGPAVSRQAIDDCEYSISGQVLYGALGWPIISATDPGATPFPTRVEALTEHVVAFTMAGLEAFRVGLNHAGLKKV